MTDPASLVGFELDSNTMSYVIIIAFFSKAYAYAALMFAEKYADAISATVIASCEPAVTFLLALVIPSQTGQTKLFSAQFLVSTLVIVVGAIVANTEFLSKSREEVREKIRSGIQEELEAERAARGRAPAGAEAFAARPAADAHVARSEAEAFAARPAADAHAARSETEAPAARSGIAALAKLGLSAERKQELKSIAVICLLVAFFFTVLCLSVNVYQAFDGMSKVRPANAFPVPIGILFGPVGALSCAVGNLVSDLFNPAYSGYLMWGFIANFAAGYLPYRVWRAVSPHTIDTHSFARVGLFVLSAFIGNMVCATILGCFSGIVAVGESGFIAFVFANDFLMTIAFGLPIFIVLVSETNVRHFFVPLVTFTRIYDKLGITQERRRIMVKVVLVADVVVYGAILAGDLMGMSFAGGLGAVLPPLALVVGLLTCLLPVV